MSTQPVYNVGPPWVHQRNAVRMAFLRRIEAGMLLYFYCPANIQFRATIGPFKWYCWRAAGGALLDVSSDEPVHPRSLTRAIAARTYTVEM